MFVDNTAAIRVAITEGFTPVTKHMAVKYFWLREVLTKGDLRMQWVKTDLNPSDVLTKPIDRTKFLRMMPVLMGYGDVNMLRKMHSVL